MAPAELRQALYLVRACWFDILVIIALKETKRSPQGPWYRLVVIIFAARSPACPVEQDVSVEAAIGGTNSSARVTGLAEVLCALWKRVLTTQEFFKFLEGFWPE
jgi:hypothetical protein